MSDKPSDEKPQFDPFKPAEPRLPGVPEKKPVPATPAAAAPAGEPPQSAVQALLAKFRALPPLAQYGMGASVLLLVVVLVAWMASGSGSEPVPANPTVSTTEPTAVPTGPLRAATPEVVEIVTLPAPVATTQEMTKPWTAKRFIVRQAGQRTPAMLLRVPAGSAGSANGYWAFLLTSPFGRCELELMTDLEKLQAEYSYRAQHAMVVDPCSRAVFHPLRMGSIGQSTYVRGEVVQGSALRPPIAIDVRVERGQVIAVRTE
jgi:hypothetical protein